MGNTLPFILLLGPLIFVHELGHLIAAKLVDVKVRRFSIGFGPPLLRFHFGETEYCIAPIPLGGYVSLLGQNPYEEIAPQELGRSLSSKALWARYFVLAAGPLTNVLLPVFLYFFFFLSQTHYAPPIIGTVMADSAAAAGDLRPGDRILSIDDRDIGSWIEMRDVVGEHADEEIKLQVERDRRRFPRYITPRRTQTSNELGILESRGVLGVYPWLYAPQVGIDTPQSRAYKGGLRTGDIVTSINGEPVTTIEKLEELLAGQSSGLMRLTYLRGHDQPGPLGVYTWRESNHAQLLPEKRHSGAESAPLGLSPANTFVRYVWPDSPAAQAGLVPGDRILAIDGKPAERWEVISAQLARQGDQMVTLTVQSFGLAPRDVPIRQELRTRQTIYKQKVEFLWLGIEPYASRFSPEPEPIRGRVTYALRRSVGETVAQLQMMWTALRQMVTFERGVEDLSSVVGMFNYAGTAADQGPAEFMLLAALISLNVGLVNLLPIPILDGGHLLFFTIEAIRRKPLGQRAREIASTIGLMFVLLLLLIALRNDIMRYWIDP